MNMMRFTASDNKLKVRMRLSHFIVEKYQNRFKCVHLAKWASLRSAFGKFRGRKYEIHMIIVTG